MRPAEIWQAAVHYAWQRPDEGAVYACAIVLLMNGELLVREMIHGVQRDHGRLDILVNNVGIQHVAPVHEFPDDKCGPPWCTYCPPCCTRPTRWAISLLVSFVLL